MQPENVLLAGLNFSAVALIELGVEPTQLPTHLESLIQSTEKLTGKRVRLIGGEGSGNWFRLETRRPTRSNYVRTKRTPNEVMMLNGRINNVNVQVTLKKPGHYDLENEEVADALRNLADVIDESEIRLSDVEIDLPPEALES